MHLGISFVTAVFIWLLLCVGDGIFAVLAHFFIISRCRVWAQAKALHWGFYTIVKKLVGGQHEKIQTISTWQANRAVAGTGAGKCNYSGLYIRLG